MNTKYHFPDLFFIFPLLLLVITGLSGCGQVRYDNSQTYTVGKDQGASTYSSSQSGKKYTVGPHDNSTAHYAQGRDERSKTYSSYNEGNRYTIGQHDKATARYTLLQGRGSRDSSADAAGSETMGGKMGQGEGNQTGSQPIQPEGMVLVLEIDDILFDFDKSVIKKQFYPELDKWVEFFAGNPRVYGEIHGHADSTGPADYNQKLSERRAQAVVNYLTGKGVEAGRLTARGFGETLPVVPNTTREGRQKNRRVELHY